MTEQYCSNCFYFENPTYEDYINGEYRIWTEPSCGMGNPMRDTLFGFVPDTPHCQDYDEVI